MKTTQWIMIIVVGLVGLYFISDWVFERITDVMVDRQRQVEEEQKQQQIAQQQAQEQKRQAEEKIQLILKKICPPPETIVLKRDDKTWKNIKSCKGDAYVDWIVEGNSQYALGNGRGVSINVRILKSTDPYRPPRSFLYLKVRWKRGPDLRLHVFYKPPEHWNF